MNSNDTIWIVGASSGIGLALAHEYHQRGAKVIVSARNAQALNTFASKCKNSIALPMDISNIDAIQSALNKLQEQNHIPDRIIIMAASYQPGNICDLEIDNISLTVNINLTGIILLVRLILPLFIQRNKGQIAICASVAGYIGLPSGQPYSCTKAALINFTECLRTEVSDTGLDIKLINPGFVKTRLTDKNTFPMPFMISAPTAARAIANGLNKRRFEVHFPKRLTLIMKVFGILPYWILLPLLAKFKPQEKG